MTVAEVDAAIELLSRKYELETWSERMPLLGQTRHSWVITAGGLRYGAGRYWTDREEALYMGKPIIELLRADMVAACMLTLRTLGLEP